MHAGASGRAWHLGQLSHFFGQVRRSRALGWVNWMQCSLIGTHAQEIYTRNGADRIDGPGNKIVCDITLS